MKTAEETLERLKAMRTERANTFNSSATATGLTPLIDTMIDRLRLSIEIELLNEIINFVERPVLSPGKSFTPSPAFFAWIAEVCKLLGWPIERGSELVEDPSWYWCYDDGMKPEDALAEARSKGVIKE